MLSTSPGRAADARLTCMRYCRRGNAGPPLLRLRHRQQKSTDAADRDHVAALAHERAWRRNSTR